MNSEDIGQVCEIAAHAWKRIHESATQIMGSDMHEILCANWEEKKARAITDHWERNPEWVRVVEAVDCQVVAFLTFRIDPEKSLGTLLNNAVSPALQGKGIGTAMYAFVLNLFREEGMAYASVGTGLDDGHARARKAYEKVGFNVAQPHVTYYQKL
jgi:ribosomal protein S18 acetylase RimI-like enzyme